MCWMRRGEGIRLPPRPCAGRAAPAPRESPATPVTAVPPRRGQGHRHSHQPGQLSRNPPDVIIRPGCPSRPWGARGGQEQHPKALSRAGWVPASPAGTRLGDGVQLGTRWAPMPRLSPTSPRSRGDPAVPPPGRGSAARLQLQTRCCGSARSRVSAERAAPARGPAGCFLPAPGDPGAPRHPHPRPGVGKRLRGHPVRHRPRGTPASAPPPPRRGSGTDTARAAGRRRMGGPEGEAHPRVAAGVTGGPRRPVRGGSAVPGVTAPHRRVEAHPGLPCG